MCPPRECSQSIPRSDSLRKKSQSLKTCNQCYPQTSCRYLTTMKPQPLLLLHLTALLLLPGTALGTSSGPSESVFCSEDTTLKSSFLSPFFESHRDVSGCVSEEIGTGGSLVHVVRLARAPESSGSVVLTFAGNVHSH